MRDAGNIGSGRYHRESIRYFNENIGIPGNSGFPKHVSGLAWDGHSLNTNNSRKKYYGITIFLRPAVLSVQQSRNVEFP